MRKLFHEMVQNKFCNVSNLINPSLRKRFLFCAMQRPTYWTLNILPAKPTARPQSPWKLDWNGTLFCR